MSSLHILAPIIIAAIYLLQVFIDYKWFDKRTKKHKTVRKILILLIFVFGGISIYTSIDEEKSSKILAQDLKDLKTTSKEAIGDAALREKTAQNEREEIKKLLVPFIDIAQDKYPLLDTSSALEKLAIDIQEVKELATRDIYKSLSNITKQTIIATVKDYTTKEGLNPPTFKFFIQQGNQNRYQVTLDLIEIFQSSGIKANVESMGLFPQSGPQYGVEIHTNSNYVNYVSGLFSAISKFYQIKFGIAVRDSEDWKQKGEFPDGEVHIIVSGIPLFASNGNVSI